MEGYKGFNKGLVCSPIGNKKQYAENTVFEEAEATICHSGMHFCALPHQVFEHYSAGDNHEFAKVEALDDVHTDDERKYTTKKLKIGAKISTADICKISVSAFFERFGFAGKIADVKKKKGAANAGDRGAANAGDWGAANAGKWGAANAGDWGAANAGDRGAANAGDWGVSVTGIDGKSSCGENGVAVSRGENAMVKGGLRATLILQTVGKDGNVDAVKVKTVDGIKIKANTWYKLDAIGRFIEEKGEKK